MSNHEPCSTLVMGFQGSIDWSRLCFSDADNHSYCMGKFVQYAASQGEIVAR